MIASWETEAVKGLPGCYDVIRVTLLLLQVLPATCIAVFSMLNIEFSLNEYKTS